LVGKRKLKRLIKLGYVYGSRKKYIIISVDKEKMTIYRGILNDKIVMEVPLIELTVRRIRNIKVLYFEDEIYK